MLTLFKDLWDCILSAYKDRNTVSIEFKIVSRKAPHYSKIRVSFNSLDITIMGGFR